MNKTEPDAYFLTPQVAHDNPELIKAFNNWPKEIKLSDILKAAKKVEESGADYKKLVVLIPENHHSIKFIVTEARK